MEPETRRERAYAVMAETRHEFIRSWNTLTPNRRRALNDANYHAYMILKGKR